MPERLGLMGASELSRVMRGAADAAAAAFPEDTLLVLIAFDLVDPLSGGRGVAQCVSNCEPSSLAVSLREVADRIERDEATGRVAPEGRPS